MTPQPPPLLDDLWQSIPTGPAPVEDLVARGRSRRRRRRTGLAGGAVALAVVAAIAFAVVPRSDDRDERLLTPPPGTRYVGIGQVVVAVPEAWPVESGPCDPPRRTSVFFYYPADFICAAPSRPNVSSVQISAVPMNDGFVGRMTPDGEVGGHQVVSRPNPAICMPGEGQEACVQSFGVPDLHAYFSVRIPRDQSGALDQVKAIRDSLTLLPAGQTAVPFVTPGSSVEIWRRALEDAGFEVRVNRSTCPANAFCAGGGITEPAAGNVARKGSLVTLDFISP
jgi:hypothetical protein